MCISITEARGQHGPLCLLQRPLVLKVTHLSGPWPGSSLLYQPSRRQEVRRRRRRRKNRARASTQDSRHTLHLACVSTDAPDRDLLHTLYREIHRYTVDIRTHTHTHTRRPCACRCVFFFVPHKSITPPSPAQSGKAIKSVHSQLPVLLRLSPNHHHLLPPVTSLPSLHFVTSPRLQALLETNKSWWCKARASFSTMSGYCGRTLFLHIPAFLRVQALRRTTDRLALIGPERDSNF